MKSSPRLASALGMLAVVLVCAASSAGVAAAQAGTPFTDAFSTATLNPWWTPFASTTGIITPASTTQVHGGTAALKLATFSVPGVNKSAGIHHPFAVPTWGKVEVWLYDSGADVNSSNYLSLHTGPFTIGTYDYDLGPGQNGSFYVYAAPGTPSGTSSIDRTLGWHHFVIRTSLTASSLVIDGITIYSGPGGTPLPDVQLEMHAPSGRPPFQTWFDDFAYDPCDGVPCGQSNSACASLTINGAGATGQGPFAVAAPAGTMMMLNWLGAANQPIVLVQTPTFIQGQNLGGGLIVDVDLMAYSIVFSGLQPGGFLWATTSAGSTMQVITVPTSLAGVVARVQGAVFDLAQTCSGGLGLMTTASFAIQF